MDFNVRVDICICDEDFVALVEGRITAKSYAGRRPDMNQPGEAPEGAEWMVDEIHLQRDFGPRSQPRYSGCLEVPGWLFDLISESDELAEQVDAAETEDSDGGDPDAAHDARFE